MYIIRNDSTEAAGNLALEEYLLCQTQLELIMLWRNAPSVIIGQNQNAFAELDLDYASSHGIKVIRRQSGGGAVFHDLGNINYTVIHPLGEKDFNNYAKFTSPIVDFLRELGVQAYLSGRNDLLIDGRKFSGNAQAVRAGRIMHHGTLMYSADVSELSKVLRPDSGKISGKGIASVRSRVTNIADHMSSAMSVEEFMSRLYDFYLSRPGMEGYELTHSDLAARDRLVAEKYGTWDWNIGKSPSYDYTNSARFPFGGVSVSVRAKGAVMERVSIRGDFFGLSDILELEGALRGVAHDRDAILGVLRGLDLGAYISGMTAEELAELF
ncbi:MAG: lipoate--protein ligase [Oscillospiraceae bacterium]|jgi:lipoate-protein ligase A|nr:lipoate--protein ligase [Oscillospiraceae bacterium]